MREIVKYIMIGCLTILALFHIYYDGSIIWKCLYFGIEYFALTILLLYISYLLKNISNQKSITVERGDPLFFLITSLYFIYKIWHNTQFYYPTISNGAEVQDVREWSIVTTIVVICVLLSLQIPIIIKNVKKR